MSRILVGLLAALLAAGALSAAASATPFAPQLLRTSVADAQPRAVARMLAGESDALNAVFLAYSDNEVLSLNAYLALLRHGDSARQVLTQYGLDPEFQDVLMRHGADAVLPVAWFFEHDMASLRARHWAGTQYQKASSALSRWWHADEQKTETDTPEVSIEDTEVPEHALTPEQRGDYAIAFLQAEGYGFLDQFVVSENGTVAWVQSERMVSAISDFLTSGVQGLERRWRSGDTIRAADIAWAGVDVLVMASAVKALRMGSAARAGALESRGAGAAVGETRGVRALLPAGLRFGQLTRTAKVAAVGATAYIVVRHPSLINALGSSLARWLELPVKLVQFLLWTLILLPLSWLAGLLWRWLIRPVLWIVLTAGRGSRRLTTKV